MKTSHCKLLSVVVVFASVALPTEAADRIRANQWAGTWTGGGRTKATSNCMTQSDADAMNGDAASIRAYLEKTIPPEICKLSDIKASASQVTYTSLCTGGKPNIITTTYYGDSFESLDSSGAKSEAKRVGACK